MRRKLLIGTAVLVVLVLGLGAGAYLKLHPNETSGTLETNVTDVSVQGPTAAPPAKPSRPRTEPNGGTQRYLPNDRACWLNFGGDPQRTSARPQLALGRPTKHFWIRGLHSYIEYAPSYCDGQLFVNTFAGTTYALNAHDGRVLWRHQNGGHTPSTPAIAGDRVLVSSIAGTETALRRSDGKVLWKLHVDAKIESSPVAIGGVAYFGATDGRLFAVDVRTGHVRWAYQTGGRINASPSIWGDRIFITTYAGSIFCLNRRNGDLIWHRYISRDLVRDESFYASPSTDGKRLYTISRSGLVLAVDARNGKVIWKHDLNTTGYSTPAISDGRVFVGDFRGDIHCYRATDGKELWRTHVGGRILAPGLVVGKLVYFSNLETKTFGLQTTTGRVVWSVPMGKYQPGIATDRHYFFTLNGIVIAYDATTPAVYDRKAQQARHEAAARAKAKAKAKAKKH